MPGFPEEEIKRLKREVSIERLCTYYGITLKLQGKNRVAHCPWHKDDTASFVVTPDKNLWHCMGACNTGGDVFTLVMKTEKVSFRHAAQILQELSGTLPTEPEARSRKRGLKHSILVKSESSLSDTALLSHVIDFYHRSFLNDPGAMRYLEKRRCLTPQAVKRFKIGYANRTLCYRVPTTTSSGKRLKSKLQSIGIYRQSGHEHLSGSVVFPIMDTEGNPVQMYGRKITTGLRKGTPGHLYLEKPLKGIWNYEGILHQKEWILCEAIIDALTLWSNGFENVTTSYGKNNFTQDHFDLIRECSPNKVIIAYDNDDTGNKASEALAKQLVLEGVNVHRALVPYGKDINGYVAALAAKDRNAVRSELDGLLKAAPVIERAERVGGRELVRVPEDIKDLSSLAAETESLRSTTDTSNNKNNRPVISGQKTAEASTQPSRELKAAKGGNEIELTIGDRAYRIRGLHKNSTFEIMKINLRVMVNNYFHVDNLDLYNARHRATFVNTTAEELQVKADIIKKDLGEVLLRLEELHDKELNKTLASDGGRPDPVMSGEERAEATKLLKDPNLLERVLEAFDTCGLVGEKTNKLTGYLSVISRKLDKPLAVIIQSHSASGKSTLMDTLLSVVPEEDSIQYSAMTGQSLFYLGDQDLKHKVLAIAEEEGAKHASYALKLLQSEGKLTIASTGKDNVTGQMVTREYHVEGPVMILTTSTAIEIDEELLNRCIVLTVDESRRQTKAIHQMQREAETLRGLIKKLNKTETLKVHKNAQRLLQPLHIINPYAHKLTFMDSRSRTRRDHQKYLTLIRAIAYLHQYQRTVKKITHNNIPIKYIEATLKDIATANTIANEVLGRSLDELPPQTRRFLNLLDEMAGEVCREKELDRCDYRFTQRDIRLYSGWSDYQVKSHLRKLVGLEYVITHKGGRGQQFVYELLYNGEGKGEESGSFLMGLIPADKLKDLGYDCNREHLKEDQMDESLCKEVSGSAWGATREHGGSIVKNGVNSYSSIEIAAKESVKSQNAYIGEFSKTGQLAAKEEAGGR